MKLGELFYRLGIKGGKESAKEVADVDRSLAGVSKKGLAVITALTGISYGFSQLYGAATRAGVGFDKFSGYTGLSTKKLQQWQWAARQSSVSAEEVEGSIKSMQSTIAGMKMSGQWSNEFQLMAKAVNMDWGKLEDPFYMLEKMREFAKGKDFGIDVQNQMLGSVGMSPDMIQFLRTSKLNPDKAPAWAIRSEGQIKAFANISRQMDNFQARLQSSFERVFVKHGPPFITAMEKALPVFEKLTGALIDFTTWIVKWFGDPQGQAAQAMEMGAGVLDGIQKNSAWDKKQLEEYIKTNPKPYSKEQLANPIFRPLFDMILSGKRADGTTLGQDGKIVINQNLHGVSKENALPFAKEAARELGNKMVDAGSKAKGRSN
ncbi:hypothetical protein phi1422_0059 [Bdellovibrio phage phi1422]|uniref:hypothetical protein n=1 Tax=Bdellovibrio phage phi1422 TaxID=1127515 RepID=UPI0002536D6F|nr:hypothetical protein F395_gp59 [Bdellovibrio phage phi1422]AFC22579.1 hypothetical protein phi1422_0059 [Bdellovibrio phage phi1422]